MRSFIKRHLGFIVLSILLCTIAGYILPNPIPAIAGYIQTVVYVCLCYITCYLACRKALSDGWIEEPEKAKATETITSPNKEANGKTIVGSKAQDWLTALDESILQYGVDKDHLEALPNIAKYRQALIDAIAKGANAESPEPNFSGYMHELSDLGTKKHLKERYINMSEEEKTDAKLWAKLGREILTKELEEEGW